MDYTAIQKLSREQYLLGRAALKTKIKALSAQQKLDKSILRMPRKTEEQKKAFRDALIGSSGSLQWTCQKRRMEITAYLNIYAGIRNAIPHYVPEQYDMWLYERYLGEAEALFKQATSAETVA